MKFKVGADTLTMVAKACVKGLNAKDPHSQTVLKLNEEKNKLFIYCTTQTTFFKGGIDVFDVEQEEDEKAEWSVDGNQLKTILSIIPSTASIPVEFVMNNKARNFIIKITGNTFKLPVFDTISPYLEEEQNRIAVVQGQNFVNHLTMIGKVVSTDADDEDVSVSCLHINFDKDVIKFMGTNNFSMAEEQIEYELEGKPDKILIPVGQISLLSRTFDPSEDIVVISTDTKFGYVDKNGIVSLVSKSSLSPLPYEPRITTANNSCSEQTVTIYSSDFKQAISALSRLAITSDNITMKVEQDKLVFSNINEDVMTVDLLETTADDTTMYFNKQTLQIIESLLSEKIQLGWSSDEYDSFVKFSNFTVAEDETEVLDDKVFIGVSTNDI